MSKSKHFLDTIYHLRLHEELILFDRFSTYAEEEELLLTDFLSQEYDNESLEYPFSPPIFNAAAAMWAAKLIFQATHLLLYKEQKSKNSDNHFPIFSGAIDPSSILSADLCLRFLPDLIRHTKSIDTQHTLIPILESHLVTWHFSGISYSLKMEDLNFDPILSDSCLKQLYANRVIEYKNYKLAETSPLEDLIKGNLGHFSTQYWKEFVWNKSTH